MGLVKARLYKTQKLHLTTLNCLAVIDMLASDQEKTAAVMHRRKHIAIVLCVFLICFYVFTEQLF